MGEKGKILSVKNEWVTRLAGYFSWAVDGGMLGSKFTLDIMIGNLGLLNEKEFKEATLALNFMLHMRPKDMDKVYTEVKIVDQLRSSEAFFFNDRVMQAMLSMKYLRRQLGRERERQY